MDLGDGDTGGIVGTRVGADMFGGDLVVGDWVVFARTPTKAGRGTIARVHRAGSMVVIVDGHDEHRRLLWNIVRDDDSVGGEGEGEGVGGPLGTDLRGVPVFKDDWLLFAESKKTLGFGKAKERDYVEPEDCLWTTRRRMVFCVKIDGSRIKPRSAAKPRILKRTRGTGGFRSGMAASAACI